jgi:hypothetical protein
MFSQKWEKLKTGFDNIPELWPSFLFATYLPLKNMEFTTACSQEL